MGNMLKDAIGQIHAEDKLKKKTEETILLKTRGYTKAPRTRRISYRAIATACMCLILLIMAGNWLIFTPTSEINIDINPSLGLGVNRFNQVVDVEGLNDDGLHLSDQLNIKFKNYNEAIEQILSNQTIEELLAKDNKVVITVTGTDISQSFEIYTEIEISAAEYDNTTCQHISNEEARKAHDVGLSYGKYLAYQELLALDPSFTPEELQGMTMKEIQDLIDRLSSNETPTNEVPLETVQNKQPTNSVSSDTQEIENSTDNKTQNNSNSSDNGSSDDSSTTSESVQEESGENGHHSYGQDGHHGHN